MRVTTALLQQPRHDWISKLSLPGLQRLAQAIGTPSTGKKPERALRIRRDLDLVQYRRSRPSTIASSSSTALPAGQQMRLLSIDMGILNLAYAFFTVPHDHRPTPSTENRPLPSLQAWHRLAVTEIDAFKAGTQRKKTKSEVRIQRLTNKDEMREGGVSPTEYARYAYEFISTLLDRHRPTHVLVERQRLRTGGKPEVYEWVLKVAMFESMLHTTLYTLQRERGMRFHVEAVDPGMVVGTVHESLALNMKREMKFSGNRPKRVRVDLVGRWLGEWAESAGLARATTTKYGEEITAPPDPVYASHEGAWRGGDVNPHNKITVGEGQDEGGDKEIRDFAMSYLREWQDNVRRRRARDGATTLLDKKWAQAAENLSYHGILKLDDLADCLVQGVTWLDWHVMREKVDTEGEATLKRLELPVSNRAMKERDPEERLDTEHI